MNDEQTKEVYAWFGAAYYHSEVLHRQLSIMFALRIRASTTLVVRSRYEEQLRRAFDMTLGNLVVATSELVDAEHANALEEAVQRRNFLAHHFWYDRAPLLASEDGMERLIRELKEHAQFFLELDEAVTSAFEARTAHLGLSQEQYEQTLAELPSGQPPAPLPSKRYLRKTENIVRAWIPNANNRAYLVLETDDGLLLQLADLGLAWAPYDSPAAEWTRHPLQGCLPAACRPRPVDAKPWEYTLRLETRAIIRIRLDKENGRIRVATKVFDRERKSS
jgi:hypothetical protein